MSARVILLHDDPAFVDLLTAALNEAGYDVEAFSHPGIAVPSSRDMARPEITISGKGPPYPGLRILVTGLAAGKPYAGPLALFLATPVNARDVVKALRQFVAP